MQRLFDARDQTQVVRPDQDAGDQVAEHSAQREAFGDRHDQHGRRQVHQGAP
jgi:hypothetical protein